MSKPKTKLAHEFAQELLKGPNLPIVVAPVKAYDDEDSFLYPPTTSIIDAATDPDDTDGADMAVILID